MGVVTEERVQNYVGDMTFGFHVTSKLFEYFGETHKSNHTDSTQDIQRITMLLDSWLGSSWERNTQSHPLTTFDGKPMTESGSPVTLMMEATQRVPEVVTEYMKRYHLDQDFISEFLDDAVGLDSLDSVSPLSN